MIPWIRIILYFSIFTLIIVRLKKKAIPLSNQQAAAAFAFKILLGWLYGYIHLRFYNGDDTWLYNDESIAAAAKIKVNPLSFFTHLVPEQVHSFQTFKEFISKSLEHDLMIKLLGIFSLFSGGNYYVNVIFFNFILFWGHYWLFDFLIRKYPDRRTALLVAIFFIPPLAFWLSGIRGDGLVFFFLTLLFIVYEKWLTLNQGRFLFYSILSLLGIFIFRSAFLLVLIPFLAGWFICERFKTRPFITYAFTYLICCLLFFGSSFLHPFFNLPSVVVNKQREFMQLPGKTRFTLQPLEPDAGSFLKAIPDALVNTLLRPYLWEAHGLLQLVTALETAAFLLFLVIALFFFKWRKVKADPWLIGSLFFALSLFIFIGLTIPFPGAIIRYKVIAELLLLAGFVIGTGHIRKKII